MSERGPKWPNVFTPPRGAANSNEKPIPHKPTPEEGEAIEWARKIMKEFPDLAAIKRFRDEHDPRRSLPGFSGQRPENDEIALEDALSAAWRRGLAEVISYRKSLSSAEVDPAVLHAIAKRILFLTTDFDMSLDAPQGEA